MMTLPWLTRAVARLAATTLLGVTVACSGEARARSAANGGTDAADGPATVAYPYGDPSVPPEAGGPGFAPAPGSGWRTGGDYRLEGSPRAVKGGLIRYWVGGFPATLRTVGKDSGKLTAQILGKLCYEPLLYRHSDTLEYVPRLATHWWISEDRTTFRYRINPRAHWADGRPVVAGDVVATWDLLMDKGLLQPSLQVVYGKFHRPRAISKYVVEVRTEETSWRNFLYFSTMTIFPGHDLEGLSGEDFLGRYQFELITGSGPYRVRPSDVRKGRSVTLRRRPDYWGWNERFAAGRYNFDVIRLVATEDYVLALEKAKKGALDAFVVTKAKDWAVDLPRLDQVERGLLLMTRLENDDPRGASGIVINMRTPFLADLRVRKALCHLYNRRKLIEKLFYDEYRHLDSYFPGTIYANPQNERVRYDPEAAVRLLAKAGWVERDADGILVKDGRRLELDLLYSSKVAERYLSVLQEDCLKAGVKIYLKQLTRASRFQSTHGNRSFTLATKGLGGRVDPNPETTWLSALADVNNNSNLAGFKDPDVDRLCEEYDRMFHRKGRIRVLRRIDGLVFRQHPWILSWWSPYIRLLFWNKFGHPEWYLGRVSGADSLLTTWWLDPEKEARLKAARDDDSIRFERLPPDSSFWRDRAADGDD